jgi:2-oxoisovalerate dehydrogenase E1 component beta subunit
MGRFKACMAVGHGGLYHSQSVEQFFLPAAGLKVCPTVGINLDARVVNVDVTVSQIVIPRSPVQAKGLLLGQFGLHI